MTYDLSTLPINRVNRKKVTIIILASIWLVPMVATLILVFDHWNLSPLLSGSRGAIAPLIWDVGALFGIFYARRWNSRLIIDERGVHITVNGQTKNYSWLSISRAHKIVDYRDGEQAAQIVWTRQIVTDNKSDLIRAEFGISADDLVSLINAGVARWGMPEQMQPAERQHSPRPEISAPPASRVSTTKPTFGKAAKGGGCVKTPKHLSL